MSNALLKKRETWVSARFFYKFKSRGELTEALSILIDFQSVNNIMFSSFIEKSVNMSKKFIVKIRF